MSRSLSYFLIYFSFIILIDHTVAQSFDHELNIATGNFFKRQAPLSYRLSNHNSISYSISTETNGENYWEFNHNYPRKGLNFSLRSFGNFELYGFGISVLPFLEFKLASTKVGDLVIKHGSGLAFISSIYNPQSNPDNNKISSHLNFTTTLDLNFRWFSRSRCWVNTGISFYHYSNGRIILPNGGLNVWSIYAGLGISKGNVVKSKKYFTKPVDYKKHGIRVGVSLGLSEYDEDKSQINTNFQLHALWFFKNSQKYRLGLGWEIGNLNKSILLNEAAFYAESELLFEKIVTRYGLGLYVFDLNNIGQWYYAKIGLSYYFKTNKFMPEGVYIGAALKAHKLKATHVDIAFGYMF